jgi:hypothetical protein
LVSPARRYAAWVTVNVRILSRFDRALPGTLSVALTGAPACGFDAVNVTVNKVRVNAGASASDTDAGWTDITLNPARKVNLLNLTHGVLDSLGQTALPAGHYSQLRLVLDANANTVVPTGGTEQPLTTPSAVQSGIKLNNEFDVAAGQQVDLVLDFNACKSVVTQGNGRYLLKPVVKVVPTAAVGISGVVGAVPVAASGSTVPSTATAPHDLSVSTMGSIAGTVTLPANATEAAYVSAQQTFAAGPTVTVKYAGADISTGAYTIANLPVAAPRYAAYSATLPLTFAAATTVLPGAGKYRVEAAGTGYTTKAIDLVDISTGNATKVDFTLTP